MMVKRQLTVNGNRVEACFPPGTPLIEVLREHLCLTGSKEACGVGECGACTVLIDGRAMLSCILLTDVVSGDVVTIEGLAETHRDLREAFADAGAFQCGFCTPGQIVRASALLAETWPTDPELVEEFVRAEMSGNICRCTGYSGIVDAIIRVARLRGKLSMRPS